MNTPTPLVPAVYNPSEGAKATNLHRITEFWKHGEFANYSLLVFCMFNNNNG